MTGVDCDPLRSARRKATGCALRSSLWGDHAISVLLPTQGDNPTLVTDRFRRAVAADEGFAGMATSQSASVLVAPASESRGLSFANVSHVYSIGFLPKDAAEYAHMAGRTGRVGQAGGGLMTSVVQGTDQVAALRAIVEGDLGRRLLVGATAEPLTAGGASDPDELIRRLDDSLLLEWKDEGGEEDTEEAQD